MKKKYSLIPSIKNYLFAKLPSADTENNFFRRNAKERECPKSSSRIILIVLIATITLLTWANFAEIDKLARGMGTVVPSSRVQEIQNLEGGILREVLVEEGQIVEAGDVVIRLDNHIAGSRYREAMVRRLDLQATIAILDALITGKDPAYPEIVKKEKALIRRQNDILEAMRAQTTKELQVLQLESDAALREAEEQVENKKQLKISAKLLEQQRKLAAAALKEEAFAAIDYIAIEQKVHNLQASLALLTHSIPRLQAEADSAKEKQALHIAELHTEYRQKIAKNLLELATLSELLEAGSDTVSRLEMRSPVRGIVKGIHKYTVGSVVSPAVTIMEIVPLNDALVIEAKFSPTDIGFLYEGQKAIVRLSAYDFSIYGGIEGTVVHVGADTTEGSQGDIFFKIKITTTENYLEFQGDKLPILIGMQADVSIITGKQSILDYLLKPLLKAQQRALRER